MGALARCTEVRDSRVWGARAVVTLVVVLGSLLGEGSAGSSDGLFLLLLALAEGDVVLLAGWGASVWAG